MKPERLIRIYCERHLPYGDAYRERCSRIAINPYPVPKYYIDVEASKPKPVFNPWWGWIHGVFPGSRIWFQIKKKLRNDQSAYVEYIFKWLWQRRYISDAYANKLSDQMWKKYHIRPRLPCEIYPKRELTPLNDRVFLIDDLRKYGMFAKDSFCPIDLASSKPFVHGCTVCHEPLGVVTIYPDPDDPVFLPDDWIANRFDVSKSWFAHSFGYQRVYLTADSIGYKNIQTVCSKKHCVETARWLRRKNPAPLESKVKLKRPSLASIESIPPEWRGSFIAAKYLDFQARLIEHVETKAGE